MEKHNGCKHYYYSRGFRQTRASNVPPMMWGCYYPGDEPGYRCKLHDECDYDFFEAEECCEDFSHGGDPYEDYAISRYEIDRMFA